MFKSIKPLLKALPLASAMFLQGCKSEPPTGIEPLPKKPAEITLTANLTNKTNIGYNVSFRNTPSIRVNGSRDGTAIYSETHSSSPSGNTYIQQLKGNYGFQACAIGEDNKEVCKTANAEIPNYLPSANFTGLPTEVEYASEIIWDLEERVKNSDDNPEDNPVPLISVTSLDNKLQTSLNGYFATLSPSENTTTESLLEVKYGSQIGGIKIDTLKVTAKEVQILEPKYTFNPFVQPNKDDLNWYGSGDANNDGKLDSDDVTRLQEIGNKTFSNPLDKRLEDRADVDGNGDVNAQDKQILEERINGTRDYLPGEWNKLQTKQERENWLKKMLAIDKTNELTYIPGDFVCTNFALQTALDLHGFLEVGFDEAKGLTNNGRFNIPTYYVNIAIPNSQAHAINTTITGDDINNFFDYYFSEPQTDGKVSPGNWNMPEGSEIIVNYAYVLESQSQGKFIDGVQILKFKILNGNPELIWINEDPNIKIIAQRSST